MRGIVGGEDIAVRVGREDGGRAGFDEDLKLLFGFLARIALELDLVQVCEGELIVSMRGVDEDPDRDERGEVEGVAWDSGADIPDEGVVELREQGAKASGDDGLPGPKDASEHEHWDEVEEAKGDVVFGTPVGDRYEGDKGGGERKDEGLAERNVSDAHEFPTGWVAR
jgi:hypothetical protein